ncbi:MAG: chemotaxis protein CheW [Gammaproteobacteria bacterium]
MTEDATDINCLLIPLVDKSLLIPRANVVEVASPDALDDNHGSVPWFLGSIEVGGSLIPVVSFEGLCGGDIPPSTVGRSRVVLLRCLSDALSSRAFGIVSQGVPQLVQVSAESLTTTENTFGESLPILCQVKMASQTPVIPDVEKLEQLISDALAVTS